MFFRDRVVALDLVRGVAVLGILAINMAGFAGPPADVFGPVTHGSFGGGASADAAVYTLWLIVFEGKMRALFSMLFGASMELFVLRAENAGREGHALQLRRLGWLAVFGMLHWLVWWGDILFDYAVAGFLALALRQAPKRLLVIVALFGFGLWQVDGVIGWAPYVEAEQAIAQHVATRDQVSMLADARKNDAKQAQAEFTETRKDPLTQAIDKLVDHPTEPLWNAISEIGEALPYMLLGIVLLRSGFFDGGWPKRRLAALAVLGIGIGGAATVAFAFWAWGHAFPFAAMRLAIGGALGFPHLLMALGIAAILVLCCRWIVGTWLGRRIALTGRAALSNYLGSTLVMTTIFYGWGFGLGGQIGTAGQAAFVVLGWLLILSWSAPWLARFRQGPLEWLWRSLVEGRKIPLAR